MTWPTTSRDVELADAIRAAIEAMPLWMELEPLDDSVHAIEWPVELIDGPRALVHPPQYVNDAAATGARQHNVSVVVEVHVPVEKREALCAFGQLRDAIAALRITNMRIMSATLTAFERGKYVSSTAASAASVAEAINDGADETTITAWSRSSAVAHKCEITVKLFQPPFTPTP